MPSFDVVSRVDMQEVDNAVNQAKRELEHRYDFRGSKSKIEFDRQCITLSADDDMKLKAMKEILNQKMVKRDIGLKSLVYKEPEQAAGTMLRQKIEITQGIDTDNAKLIAKKIKDLKLKKVQAQIQGEQVRVSGPKKDVLQEIMQTLDSEINLELQYVNFKD
jgi:hypothetical protein